METIEDIGFGGLKLIQSREGFRFGIDAVLLADFACRMCTDAGNIIDLGTGNGIIPIVISHKKEDCSITGIDVQPVAIDMAERSCRLNGLEDRISFMECDVSRLAEEMPQLKASADMAVSNPPYVARGAGITNDRDSRFISRQETTADIEDFVSAAAFVLRNRGHFVLVHRPARLVDIMYHCRKYGLEPKNIQFVTPRQGARPNIVLLDCIKGGGRELSYCESLHVYEEDGSYSAEIMKIYEKTR